MPFKKGHIMSAETIEKLRQSKLGSKNPMYGKKPYYSFPKGNIPWNKGKHGLQANENHPGWKDDKVSYIGIHAWIRRHLGDPSKCDKCGIDNKKYDWHNTDGRYERDFKKWVRLCKKCHAHIHKNWEKGIQGKLRFTKKHVP